MYSPPPPPHPLRLSQAILIQSECLSSGVDVLVIMVTNEAQAESVLFGDLGAVQGMFQRFSA